MVWKATFRESYVVKRRAEEAQEGEGKPFGGSAVIGGQDIEKHGQLWRRGHAASVGPAPLINQMQDSLEGYLDNIAAVATQNVAKGWPLAELAASLDISVDTVTRRQQEIKCMYEQINTMKDRGTQASSIRKMARGGLVETVCSYSTVVGRTVTHKNNSCYFDPKKITD